MNRATRLLIIGSQVRALVRPPSSLRKPHVSDTTPNRAFLRGFSATQFPDFSLCRRSRILVAVFGALSPHLKFRSRRSGLSAKFDRVLLRFNWPISSGRAIAARAASTGRENFEAIHDRRLLA